MDEQKVHRERNKRKNHEAELLSYQKMVLFVCVWICGHRLLGAGGIVFVTLFLIILHSQYWQPTTQTYAIQYMTKQAISNRCAVIAGGGGNNTIIVSPSHSSTGFLQLHNSPLGLVQETLTAQGHPWLNRDANFEHLPISLSTRAIINTLSLGSRMFLN